MPSSPAVLLEGFHAVKHALRFAPDLVGEVRVADAARTRALAGRQAPDVLGALLGGPSRARRPTTPASRRTRSGRSRTAACCACARRRWCWLDRPRHPGNAGAVRLRVAAAAGAAGVAVTGPRPATLRGAAGLHYALPVLRVEPDEVVGPLVVLDAEGDVHTAVPAGAVLVVGSERDGVSARRCGPGPTWCWRCRCGPGSATLNLATAVAAALYRG